MSSKNSDLKKVVVFTGAGISEESGISTFRGSNGLWEKYRIEEVATPEAWQKNPKLVLDFYNQRRQQIIKAQPNEAHLSIVALEKSYDVTIITQNIDDLHERAGSKKVLHLHGEIMKSKSELDFNDQPQLYPIKKGELNWGETCAKGGQLRPNVVWFGEAVPEMVHAEKIVARSDIFIIVGTSLNVYPAAGLVYFAENAEKKYLIDPFDVDVSSIKGITTIKEKAGIGMKRILMDLL